jgi:hypothetical protein
MSTVTPEAEGVTHAGRSFEEALGVWTSRGLEHRGSRALLSDKALLQHEHLIGDVGHHTQVVGDEEQGEAEVLAKSAQQFQDGRLDGYVEGRCDFVTDDHGGVSREGPRNSDALLLATGARRETGSRRPAAA